MGYYTILIAAIGEDPSVLGNRSRTRCQKSPKCTDRMAGNLSN